MSLGIRLLKSIGLTVGSMVLFWLVTTIYFAILSLVYGTFSIETVSYVFLNSLMLTVVVFGALLYFPIQTVVLTFGKFTRLFLFVLPGLGTVAAIVITLYYLKVAPPENRPIADSYLLEYLWLGIAGFVFVVLNNLLFVRAR